MRAGRRTDGDDETDSRFSHFCGRHAEQVRLMGKCVLRCSMIHRPCINHNQTYAINQQMHYNI